jgi:hypothetical protein
MRHFLTSILAFHWAAAFAVLAMVCVSGGDTGAAGALNLVGVTLPGFGGAPATGPAFAAFLSLAFAVVSVLFFWALLTTFGGDRTGDDDQVIRMAFAAAACVLTLLLVVGAVQGAGGLFSVVSAHLSALMASYLAIYAERWSASLSDVPDEDDLRAAARVMAAGAAHSSMLSRLSGRADLTPDGGR